MKTTKCLCSYCGTSFDKPTNEYNRRIAKNSNLYCSRRCTGKALYVNFGDKVNTKPPINTGKANPFKYYLRNCKKRFQEVNIDLEYLENLWDEQKGICPYTHVSLVLNNHSHRHSDIRYTASLDRIDSSKGYIKGNIQFISMAVNFMKHTMSHEDLVEFLLQITKNLLQ